MYKRCVWKQVLAGILAMVSILSAAASPVLVYAEDSTGRTACESDYPDLDEVRDLLAEDEIVSAEDLELEIGSGFDVKTDFTGLRYDSGKVKITFHEAEDSGGTAYSSDRAGTYKAVYYVEPTSGNPIYRISRTITVKEAETETEASVSGNSDAGSGDSEEESVEDDGESDSQTEALTAEGEVSANEISLAEDEGNDSEETMTAETVMDEFSETDELVTEETDAEEQAADEVDPEVTEEEEDTTSESSLSTEGATELTTEEFESEIEESEEQETVDEETGLTLAAVLTEAEDEVDLADLEVGETATFTVSTSAAASLTATASAEETVTITRGSWYYYSDYGLGSYVTAPYYISYGSVTATAYCIQPSKGSPDDGTYTITKLKDSKVLAKVCYYGTKSSGDEGFFATYYPDFSTGKRFIITHLAAAYASGNSDAFSGANDTGKKLAMELYDYCVSQPEIPDVEMEFSNDDVTAYISGSRQRTEEITFEADELQTITFNLPDGVKLHNVTTGETSSAGDSVTISGGTVFYLSAPLTQATDVKASWSTTMKGSVTKDYSAYKITTGSSTQNLAFVFGEGVRCGAGGQHNDQSDCDG